MEFNLEDFDQVALRQYRRRYTPIGWPLSVQTGPNPLLTLGRDAIGLAEMIYQNTGQMPARLALYSNQGYQKLLAVTIEA